VSGGDLAGRRVLVVEDEYVMARELAHALRKAGAIVVGPVPTVGAALAAINAEAALDVAVLDLNLRGEASYEVADALDRMGVPYVFTTGYSRSSLPLRYRDRMMCEKPVDLDILLTMIGGHADGEPGAQHR
jgi:CheY-like chemotaxis protein